MVDFLIIGAGVVGSTIARELSKYDVSIFVLEKEADVASVQTKANSAIVHSGHDPKPGTLKAKLNFLGNQMYPKMCQDLSIPLKKTGAYVLSTDEEEDTSLDELYLRAQANGVEVEMLSKEEIEKTEKNLSDLVIRGLYLPNTYLTFGFEVALANMESAILNGAKLSLNTKVESITKNADHFVVKTNNGEFLTKNVISAAGLSSEEVCSMVTKPKFKVMPRRGEYFILDKLEKGLVNRVIYPTPTKNGKGVIAIPMMSGNIIIGPSSTPTDFDHLTVTTKEGLDFVRTNIKKTVNVDLTKTIRTFSGSRASIDSYDFIIEESEVDGFYLVAGIDSPGLTAAPAIAKYLVDIIGKKEQLIEKHDFINERKRPVKLNDLSYEERNALIQKDSEYGKIVCLCENVSLKEVKEALDMIIKPTTIEGIKMRTRVGFGRCQSGFCQAKLLKIISSERGLALDEVKYHKTNILIKESK